MVYCPSEKFEPDLLYSISRSASTINTKIDTISTNITQLMASNGYLASINNKLASLTSIGTKLDTISDLLNANTYCCGYITNSSGAEFPTQSISFSIAEQIVARLNSEMQGKNLTVLKRDGSGTTTSTFRRAYVTSSSMICLVMSGGTYYLCDSTNTIFKAGSDRLSNIYSKVNSIRHSPVLPVQPIGQLLNLHFQISSFFIHTLTVILCKFGCVNLYASIHFAMSFSGIVI